VPDVRPELLGTEPESSTLSTSIPVVPPATGIEVESSRRSDTPREPAVVLTDVSKVYGDASNAVHALDEVNLTVSRGEFVCMLGASGCGKSTLLNILAGLDRPSRGTSQVLGRTGLMFQESALFPWLTVTGNVDLALKLRKVPKDRRKTRVAELLELVNLSEFAKKRPHELSGGMRQRVALARALAQDADVLLMDEPFGALDAMTRDVMHDELERLWTETGLTVVFVTHNVREAVRLGDRVVLLSSRPGHVIQEFPIVDDRPRRIDSPVVANQAAAITDRLKEEVRRHAGDD
jgi:NitT/TauT family transport system ATP-binding protein